MGSQTRHEEESVAGGRRERFARALERHGRHVVGTERHSGLGAHTEVVRQRRLLEYIDVLQDAIQLRDQPGKPRVVNRKARELRHMEHVIVGNRHLLPPAFEFSLRQHQCFPADLFVFEIDPDLQVAPTAGEFGDGA